MAELQTQDQVQNENKFKVEKRIAVIYRRLKKNPKAIISLVIIVLIILGSIFIPMITGYHYNNTNATNGYQAPGGAHLLGTDQNGRDIVTRLFYGGRISMFLAVSVVSIVVLIGTVFGCVSGYYGKWVDGTIMRICEILSGMPFLLISITVIPILGVPDKTQMPGLNEFVMNIGITNWKLMLLVIIMSTFTTPSLIRLVRGQVLTIREMEYMEACEALGINDRSRMFKHILPNVLASVIVHATLNIASVILMEAGLSFLGLGVDPITPTWGSLLQDARQPLNLQARWWLWMPAGLLLFLTVMCFNIFGDGLRDALDPKMKD